MWMMVAIICILPLLYIIVIADIDFFMHTKELILSCINGDYVTAFILALMGILPLIIFVIFFIPANFYIIAQFFIFLTGNPRYKGLKITENNASKLNAFIDEIAKSAGLKRPKDGIFAMNITLSGSIFPNGLLRGTKAITLNVAQIEHLNRAELSSIIIQSMQSLKSKTSLSHTIIYMLYNFISCIYEISKKWINITEKMKNYNGIAPFAVKCVIKIYGYILYYLTFYYIELLNYVEGRYKMSMGEYESFAYLKECDLTARQVGSTVKCSSMLKTNEINRRYKEFVAFIENLANNGFIIENYWKAYSKTQDYISQITGKPIHASTLLNKPIYPQDAYREISTHENSSDYTDQERIRELNYPAKFIRKGSTRDLIPYNLVEKLGNEAIENITQRYKEQLTLLSEEELDQKIEEYFCDYPYMKYFEREVIPFDFENYTKPDEDFDPLSDANIELNCKYDSAKKDYDIAFEASTFKENSFVTYKGESYKAKDVPLDEITAHLEMIKGKVKVIDESIYATALKYADNPDEVRYAYSKIFYAQEIMNVIDGTITPKCMELIDTKDKIARASKKYQTKVAYPVYFDFQQKLKRYVLNKVDHEYMESYLSDDEKYALECYNEELTEEEFGKDPDDKINLIVAVYSSVKEAHKKILKEKEKLVIKYAKRATDASYENYKFREMPVVQLAQISDNTENIEGEKDESTAYEKQKEKWFVPHKEAKDEEPVYDEEEEITFFSRYKYLIILIGLLAAFRLYTYITTGL